MDKLLIFSNMGFFLCSILLFNEQQYVSGLMLLLTGIILTEFQINKCLDDCSEPIINKEKIILAISFALYLTIIKKQSIGNTGLYLLSLGVLQILAHKKGDNYKIFSSLWTILFAYGFYLLTHTYNDIIIVKKIMSALDLPHLHDFYSMPIIEFLIRR